MRSPGARRGPRWGPACSGTTGARRAGRKRPGPAAVPLLPRAAPAHAHIDGLLPDVLDGRIEPGRVFDRAVGLDEVPDGYRVMAGPRGPEVLVRP
ncbi:MULTISPECIES: hypothetical protein [unclassified Streptomyces]|uniref:hypothetical protein n=1 Tax=unclassified Streptomyces TaxID=2593676 RepID=UPI002E1571D4